MDRLISRYLILPIAETTAPFWLNIPTQTVVALIRTGTDAESGENVYLPAQIKLPVEDWNSLRDVVKTSGAARLTITRVTEISNEVAQRWPTQGLGAHFLALRLGTWMYVVPAGAFLGAHDAAPELVALVRHRLSPNPIAAMEEGVTSLAVRCAERTMNWVGKVKSWRLGDDIYPLAPWAVHVLNLGYDVARERGADPAQAEACNRELLLFVFGDGVMADGVAAGGLALGADDRSWFGAATRLLADTGAAPLTELPAAAKEIPSDVLGTFFERTDRGWDVRVPAHLRGVAE
jgi:hypothetical protein